MSKYFPPEFRLKSKSDFNALRGGRRLYIDGLCFVYRKNHLPHARLGLAVSKKYGNAVTRNRLKRLLREAFRQHRVRQCSVDILVFPTKYAMPSMNFPQIMNRGLNRIVKFSGEERS